MIHTYEEALDWIHSRLRLGIKPGLVRMEWMLERLGNPERDMKVIHVGGTNGKGSTVTYLRSILNEAGYRVGAFTSPYIEQFNERISVDGKPIADEKITELVNVIKPLAEELEGTEIGSPTEFEVITAMAIYYFAKMDPMDITIFEVGLGGRFDSTNVVHPLVSIITNVGMDHTQILGDTIDQIAYEKAGIIKSSVPVFTAVQVESAHAVLQSESISKNAALFSLGNHFSVLDYAPVKSGEQFTFIGDKVRFEKLEISLLGRHQTENAAGALSALLYLIEQGYVEVNEDQIRTGLKIAYWPGRMEVLHNEPVILIDGAHNPEGLRAFAATLKNRYQGKKVKVVFSALRDKDLTEMFAVLSSIDAEVYFTEFDFPRAATAEELKKMSGMDAAKTNKDWRYLLEELTDSIKSDELLAVTGSLYFISEVKPELLRIIGKGN